MDDQDDVESEHDSSDADYGSHGARRPMNAFFIFCKRHRDIVREKYPHLENRSITKILGEWWANLSPHEKSPYFEFAKEYREAFLKANPDFKWYKIPLPPARTHVTRPSNYKCLQMQKERKHPKLFTCGITVGKLADEAQLGGLNSLITNAVPVTSPSDSHPTNAIPSSPTSPSPTSSSASTATNILKPPKKRYIVNGEFQCHTPSPTTSSPSVTLSDNQTHSACSALLQLAEICANTDGKKSVASSERGSSSEEKTILNGPSTSQYNCTSPSSIHQCVQESQVSSVQSDFQKSGDLCLSPFGKASVIQCSSSIKSPGPEAIPEHQDEPLNLCKEKEKTYRASNQKLIDHFVDKFLCDANSHESSGFKPSLDPFSGLLQSVKLNKNHQRVAENRPGCFEFSLSAAIESVVDQVYNKDLHETNRISQSKPLRVAKQESPVCVEKNNFGTKPQNNFTDRITSDSQIKLDEPSSSENQCNLKREHPAVEDQGVHTIPTENQAVTSFQPDVQLEKPSSSEGKSTPVTSSNEKVETRSQESESKCRLISPPKKSRMWCNIFMNEQQNSVNKSEAVNSKRNLVAEVSSPVRRNSQRTCKGRRYQALITEGLLQSTKERKIASVKKHAIPERPSKSKSPTSSEICVLKSSKKKRKKDSDDQTETEGSDMEKCTHDMDEKIASLPECSRESLKPESSVDTDDIKQPCDSSHMSQDVTEKFLSSDREIKTTDSSSADEDVPSVISAGRFKIGNFDLEQHIAALPTCDIEVLNKRKNKKN